MIKASEVESAIRIVLNGGSNVREANDFIIRFVELAESWEASLGLFQSPDEHIRYFVSNIIYTKVKKHWVSQLNAAQQEEIYRFLISVVENPSQYNCSTNLRGSSQFRAFLNRVLLSLCCVSSFAVGGLHVYVDMALRKVHTLLQPNPSDLDINCALIGLEMLVLLPTEIDSLDIGEASRSELEDQLVKCAAPVIEKIEQVCTNDNSGVNRHVVVGIINAMRSWLLRGITLSGLYNEYRAALGLVCASLRSDDAERVKLGCGFLRELVCVSDYPSSSKRDEAISFLIHSFVDSTAQLAPFFDLDSARGDQEAAYEICYCMVTIASQEIALVTSPQFCNVDFFRLLLSCATQKPRKIASLTFDFWLSLQDTPVAERHPYTHQEIFENLLEILLKQSMYPPDFINWEEDAGDDDEDDFKDFRDRRHGIQEVMLLTCHALRGRFFELLSNTLGQASANGEGSPGTRSGDTVTLASGACAARNGWQTIESCLFLLQNCMEAVKGMVKSESDGEEALNFLTKALHLIFSLPDTIVAHPAFQTTLCQALGSLTFLLTNSTLGKASVSDESPFTGFFLSALNFLFGCLSSPTSSASAAKAILQLCVHGQKILVAPSRQEGHSGGGSNPLVDSLIAAVTEKVADVSIVPPADLIDATTQQQSPLLPAIEAVVRVLVALPKTHVSEALTRLGRPMVDCLCREISKPADLDFNRISLLLQYSGQLIRFSDANDDSQILLEFLSVLWPQLHTLEADSRLNGSSKVVNSLFELYSRAIMSAKALVIPEMPRITQTVVTVFQMRNSSSEYSMRCASVIVEALCNQGPEKDAFLINLLQHCVMVLAGHVNSHSGGEAGSLTIFGYEPECIESFFRFLYSFLIMCPAIIVQSPEALASLPHLGVYSLIACKENGPLRLILTVIQAFWWTTTKKIDATTQKAFLAAALPSGKHLIGHLLDIMNGSMGVSSIVWPNAIDTLYYVMIGCESDHIQLSREWVGAKMAEEHMFDKLTRDRKEILYETMFRFAESDRRRFKQLMHDICRICTGEADVELLRAYE